MIDWKREPTTADLALTGEERMAAAQELRDVLPARAYSAEEAALYILRHVPVVAKLDGAGRAWCGPLAEKAVRLARAAGLPTRCVDLFDLGPPLYTHVVPEAYYDGMWHLVDATFGVFFRWIKGRAKGALLPLDALMEDRSAPLFRTAAQIWTGGPAPTGPVLSGLVPADWLASFYGGTGLPALYREMLHRARFCEVATTAAR